MITRSEKIVLGCCGFHGDVLTVIKILQAQMKVNEQIYILLMYQMSLPTDI